MKLFELDDFPNKPSGYTDYRSIANYDQTNPELEKIAGLIKTNCSDILSIYKDTGNILYRGFIDLYQPFFKALPRENRKSRDGDINIHNIINNYLKEQGFEARRDNSFFCISKMKEAKEYGEAYLVFPKNDFKYTWLNSKVHGDDLSVSEGIYGIYSLQKSHSYMSFISYIDKFLDYNLFDWIRYKIKYDIKLQDRYYNSGMYKQLDIYALFDDIKLNVKNEITEKLVEIIKFYQTTILPENLKEMPFENSNIRVPLDKGYEVYIHGECYFIHLGLFGRIRKLIGL